MAGNREAAICDYEERAKEYILFHGCGEVVHLREVLPRKPKKGSK